MPGQDPQAELAPQGQEQAPAEGGGEQQGDLASLLQNLTQGAQILSEVVQGAAQQGKGSPELAQKAQNVMSLIGEITQEIAGGGQAPRGDQGVVSQEGGASGVPMSPAG